MKPTISDQLLCVSTATPTALDCSISERAVVAADARIHALREELTRITRDCAAARELGRTGSHFFLLRKKWQLMQELFEVENRQRLRKGSIADAVKTERHGPE